MKYYPQERRRQHVWQVQALDCQLADRASQARPIRDVMTDERLAEYPPAERLLQDATIGLYKYSPELKETDGVAPSSLLNHAVIQQLSGEPRWKELHQTARLDQALAILGAASLGSRVMEALGEEVKEQARRAAEADQQAQQQQALAEALAEMAAAGGPQAPQRQQQARQAQQAAQQAAAQAQAAAQQAVQMLQGNGGAQGRLRVALRQAADETRQQQSNLAGWGMGGGPEIQVPPEQRLAVAEALHNNRKLAEIARWAGRLKNIGFGVVARRIPSGVGDIAGYKMGRDLAHLAPIELGRLAHPDGKWDFARRYALGQLQCRKLKRREKTGLGSLVVAYDGSGSMSGEKEIRAKGLALALLAIAQRERRSWAGIEFSAKGQVRKVVFERPHQEVRPGDLIDLAGHFFAGGTDFKLALDTAREVIGERPFAKADILFITDGIAALTAEYVEDLLAWKKRTGVRIFSIIVSGGSAASVEAWSDRVLSDATVFTNNRKFEDAATQVFEHL
jgi:uncharacterized protein with von Willebrand factor type A (vWA) domain